MKKARIFLITILSVLVLLLLLGVSWLLERTPKNPAGTVGNTGGNLINNGLFCEQDGVVYFSNPYDYDALYSMAPEETAFKKLGTVGVSSINAGGNYLYYYQNHSGNGSGLGFVVKTVGMYRSKKNGKGALCLKRDPVGILTLIDNAVYYQHYTSKTGTYLDRIAIDKSSEETLFTQMLSPASVSSGKIYYHGVDTDHYLYAYDTATKTSALLWEHNLWNPIVEGDYAYFMDLESNYQLHRYNLYSGEHEALTTDRIDTFNVYGDMIYYQISSAEPALMRMRTDGSEKEVVSYGIFNNLNITSQYVYFTEYNKPTPVYHQSTFGAVNVGVFQPPAAAE